MLVGSLYIVRGQVSTFYHEMNMKDMSKSVKSIGKSTATIENTSHLGLGSCARRHEIFGIILATPCDKGRREDANMKKDERIL